MKPSTSAIPAPAAASGACTGTRTVQYRPLPCNRRSCEVRALGCPAKLAGAAGAPPAGGLRGAATVTLCFTWACTKLPWLLLDAAGCSLLLMLSCACADAGASRPSALRVLSCSSATSSSS